MTYKLIKVGGHYRLMDGKELLASTEKLDGLPKLYMWQCHSFVKEGRTEWNVITEKDYSDRLYPRGTILIKDGHINITKLHA